MTTPQPAALPEKLIFSERLAISEAAQVPMDAECCRVIQATLDYISSNYALAALQPQPAAAVSDEEIEEIARGKSNHIEFARAILALRPQAVPMTDGVFDLICNAIDKADTITLEGDYMLDSDDCIAVVRVMQALLSIHRGITAQGAQGGEGK